MDCLIIAAGRGSRLSTKGDSKPLIPLLGLPLIERVILTATKAGVSDFYVITGHNGQEVGDFLDELSRRKNIKITHIANGEWEKENGLSVLQARKLLNENFVLLMGDHIFEESILSKLMDEGVADGKVMLAVDHKIDTNGLNNVDDATKVLVENKRILEIGKNIKRYNAYDTGVFLCSPAVFEALRQSSRNGDCSLSGGIRVLAQEGKVNAFNINNDCWVDVDDEESFKKAEDILLANFKKISDGPVSRYLNRPISRRITKYLLRTNITPNFVSLFSFTLSILGGLFFFLGGYVNLAIGGILAQTSSIVDGCDGEVARLRFQTTEFGGWFDAVLDRYADAFLLFALTCHIYFGMGDFLILFIGFLAIIGTFMNSYTADKYDGLMKRKLGSRGHYFRMGRDVRMFIIFVGALVNQPLLTLLIIALLMNAENIRRVLALYKNG